MNNASEGTFEDWGQNAVHVRIRLSSLMQETVTVTKLKYSLINTIGAIGGLCGLVIGASVMTSIELTFFLADIIGELFLKTTAKICDGR